MNENKPSEPEIDKTAFSVTTLESKSDERLYWWSKTPVERLNQLEYLRKINYGAAATQRLQRVLEHSQ